jgi:hypothetical protein
MTLNEARCRRTGGLSLGFLGPKTPWGFLGLLPLLTGAVGFCPAYALMGVTSRRT